MSRIKEKLRRALAMFLSLCVISPAFQGVALADIPGSSQTSESEENQEGKIVIELDGKRLLEEVKETVRLGDELRMEEWGMSFYYQDEEGNRHSYKTYEEIFGADSGSIYEISGDKIPFIDEEGISEALAENDAGLYVFVKLDDGTEPIATPGNGDRRATASNGDRRATSSNAEREPENSDTSMEGMPEDDSQKVTMQEEETEIRTATGNNAMQAASGNGIGQKTAEDYGLTGREKILFLFVNQSDRQLEFQIEIDGFKMKSVTVGRDSVLTRQVPAAETELPDGEEAPEDGKDGNIQLATGSNAANGSGIGHVMEPVVAEEEENPDGIQADSAQNEIITSGDSDPKKDDLYLEEGRVTEEDIPKEDIAKEDIPNDHIPEENTAVSGEGSRDENSSEEVGESSTEDRKDKEGESKNFSLTEKESEESSKEKAEEIGEVFDREEFGGNESNSDIEENHDSYEADPVLEEPESSHQEENESYIEEISEMSVSHHKAYRVGTPVEGDIDDGEFYGESDIEILFKDVVVYDSGIDGVDLATTVYPSVILDIENEPAVMALRNEESSKEKADIVALASVDTKDILGISETNSDLFSGLTMNLYKYNRDKIAAMVGTSPQKFCIYQNNQGAHNSSAHQTGANSEEGGAFQGIVADRYENGRIILNKDMVPQGMGNFGENSDGKPEGIAALFPKNEDEGGEQGKENVNGVAPFYNVKLGSDTFQYTEEAGRYTFCALNQQGLDVHMNRNPHIKSSEINLQGESGDATLPIQPIHFNDSSKGHIFDIRSSREEDGRRILEGHKGVVVPNTEGGFMVFGKGNNPTDPNTYIFGMNLSFDFNLPYDGKIARTEEMVFSFIGDDDVWVFLKDEESGDEYRLSLDLGGLHYSTYGSINFATGIISYGGVHRDEKTYSDPEYWYLYGENDQVLEKREDGKFTYKDKNLTIEKCLNFTRAPRGSSKKFACEMYYMERGYNDTNCFIDMNLLVVPKNLIKIRKEIQGSDDKKSSHLNETFYFNVVVSKDKDALMHYRQTGNNTSDENGRELVNIFPKEIAGQGETTFDVEAYEGEYFYVEEVLGEEQQPQKTEWSTTTVVDEESQTGSGTKTNVFQVTQEDGCIAVFINDYGEDETPVDPTPEQKTIKVEKYVNGNNDHTTTDYFTVSLREDVERAKKTDFYVTPGIRTDTGLKTDTERTYIIQEEPKDGYELEKISVEYVDVGDKEEEPIQLNDGIYKIKIPENTEPVIKVYNTTGSPGRIRVQKKVIGTDMEQKQNKKNFMIHLKNKDGKGTYIDTSVILGNEGVPHWVSDWILIDKDTVLELEETELKEFTIESVRIDGRTEPIVDSNKDGKYGISVKPGDKFTIIVTNKYEKSPYFHSDAGKMNDFDKQKRPMGTQGAGDLRTLMAVEARFLVTEQKKSEIADEELPERLL